MWLPIWVLDGNGLTMACLAVWIRNVALRWGASAMTMRSEAVDATAPVDVARIGVATSETDFTRSKAPFAVSGARPPLGQLRFAVPRRCVFRRGTHVTGTSRVIVLHSFA